MFIYFYIHLNEGDLCKITSPQHQLNGQIVKFKRMDYYAQRPCFVFETPDKEPVILPHDSCFETLPYIHSIRFLLNLALQTNDKEWFDELVYKLKYETQ